MQSLALANGSSGVRWGGWGAALLLSILAVTACSSTSEPTVDPASTTETLVSADVAQPDPSTTQPTATSTTTTSVAEPPPVLGLGDLEPLVGTLSEVVGLPAENRYRIAIGRGLWSWRWVDPDGFADSVSFGLFVGYPAVATVNAALVDVDVSCPDPWTDAVDPLVEMDPIGAPDSVDFTVVPGLLTGTANLRVSCLDLEEAERRWISQGASTYRLGVERFEGDLGAEYGMVEVIEGEGEITAEGYFEEIRHAIDHGIEVMARFDPDTGLPVRLRIGDPDYPTTNVRVVAITGTAGVRSCPFESGGLESGGFSPALSPRISYVWRDPDGCPVSGGVIGHVNGSRHCEWQQAQIMLVGDPIGAQFRPLPLHQYLWDPEETLAALDMTQVPEGPVGELIDRAALPSAVRPTGYHLGAIELWTDPADPAFLFLVNGDNVQRWPEIDFIACA